MKHNGRFIFYHRTNAEKAREILASGFTNSSGYFQGNRIWTGVWLSSAPVDTSDTGDDEALLIVKLEADERVISRWEWTAEGRSSRQWLIPAALINKCAKTELVDQFEFSPVAA
jgi:hypothetical protein